MDQNEYNELFFKKLSGYLSGLQQLVQTYSCHGDLNCVESPEGLDSILITNPGSSKQKAAKKARKPKVMQPLWTHSELNAVEKFIQKTSEKDFNNLTSALIADEKYAKFVKDKEPRDLQKHIIAFAMVHADTKHFINLPTSEIKSNQKKRKVEAHETDEESSD